MENRTDFYFLSFEFNNKTPVFSVTPDFLLQWREGKRKEKLCKTIYRDVMSYTECAQLLNATSLLQSWTKDPFVAATNDSLFGYYGNGTAFNRSLGGAAGDAEIIVPVLPPFVLWQSILIAISLALCIILTIGGNILVLLAFIVDKNIRQPSNYFIASLAATDMLIGTVSMPFFTIYVLMGYWDLGPLLCDLWLSVDYTVCLVSQYTVLLITIDRYCSVKFAAKYRSWRTKNRVLYMVTTTWIVPALLFFTSIFGWEHFVGYRDLQPGECAVQFLKDPIFNTALIIGYYWSTLIVLFILYAGIYKTAYDMQKKSESKQRKMQSMMALSAGAMSGMANRAAGIAALSRTQSTPVSQPDNKVVCVGGVAAPTTQSAPNDAKKGDERFEGKREDAGKDQRNSQHIVVEDNQAKQVSIKSEKSSSPAFDSDDDSTANPPRPEQTNAKRTSLLDIIIHSGMPIHTLGDKAKGAQPQLNCVDEDEERAVRLDPIIADTEPAPPAHLRSTISTDAAATPTHHHHHQTAALAKLLPLLSGKPRPSSLRLDGAYDILVGLDGADLRYMDESSLVVPSPTTTTAGDSSSPSASPARAHTHAPQPNSHLLQSALATSARREASRKKRHRAPIGDASVSEAAKESCSEVSSPVHVSTLPRTIADQRVRVDVVKPTFLQRVRRRMGGGAPAPRVCAPFDGFARQKSKSENRARKALRTISFILGAFAICWTPYHVFALVEGFCATPPCVNGHLYMFSYFLCYANSPLNPFCYAMSNQQFKKTFTRILKGDLHVT